MKKRRAESRKGMIGMVVAFPPDLHRRLALTALDERASMNELIRDAVKAYLDRKSKKRKGVIKRE